MKKFLKSISVIWLVALVLNGCGDASDSLAAQNETVAKIQTIQESDTDNVEQLIRTQEDVLKSVPKKVTEEFSSVDGVQKIDAEVILPETMIMTGTLGRRTFTEEEIRKLLKNSKVVNDIDRIQIRIDPELVEIYDESYEKNQGVMSEEQPQNVSEYCELVNELLNQLGSGQKVDEGTAYQGENGDIYDFHTTGTINNIIVEKKSLPNAYSSYGALVAGKLGSLSIISDYIVENEKEASLMEFADILISFKNLMESGMIVPAPSGQAVDKIRLCYMAEEKGSDYTFYPVWNFEVPYTADWLKGEDGPHAVRYVVLDACTGELVEHHIGGVE